MMAIDIKPNKKAGLAKAGNNALKIDKALAAIDQIDADLAALPSATTADLKLILERVIKRQRRIIQFLMKSLDE